MTIYEVLLFSGSGYVCGLSTSTGLMISLWRGKDKSHASGLSHLGWAMIWVINLSLIAFGVSFLFPATVIGDGSNDSYYLRLLFFCIGGLLAFAFVLYSFHKIGKKLESKI